MSLPAQSNKTVYLPVKRVLRIFISVILLIWAASFSTLMFHSDLNFLYPFAQKSFSVVCHQDPARSFSISGINMLVCARCAGIYTGAAFISLLLILIKNIKISSIKFLYLSLIPLIIDVILYNTGIYNYNKPLSFTTGFILGSVVFIYILAAMENYIYRNDQQ